jgi:NADPH:quinone reductase-like Zn-dependent oxidoreductase
MQAAYSEAAGGPEVIEIGERPKPEPGPDQILIRNHAAGVGPWDWKSLAGTWRELTFPYIPGSEAAGVVEAAPEGSEFKVGDEVWGRVGHAYAEYVVSKGKTVVPKPAGISFEGAAGLVIAASTAYEGIVDRLNLLPAETIIITSAAGGVGSVAVQIAAAIGARVIAVASAANHEYVRSLGAGDVFDYHDSGWPDALRDVVPGGADVLFDSIGSETGQAALKALRDGARASFVAYPPPDVDAEGRGITGEFFSAEGTRERFEAINKLVADGKLKPQVTKTLPLDQARQALERSRQGHTRGKIVLTI